MEGLIAEQQALFHSISRFTSNFKKLGKSNWTAAKIRSRISTLKDTWARCSQVNLSLIQIATKEDKAKLEYFKSNQFDFIEDNYQETLDYLAECLEEVDPGESSKNGKSTSQGGGESVSNFTLSHLPPISLPTFSGKCEEWESFRDRFTALIIDNANLSSFARMHFLSSSLIGSALEHIRALPVTANNFEIAWKTLVSRYENKRRLIEVQIAALYNLPTVSRESPSELNRLRDTANKAIASLRNLGRSPAEIQNDLLVYGVSHKLDRATFKAWKLSNGDNPEHVPTYEALDRFLANRARALEELSPLGDDKVTRQPTRTSAAAAATPKIACPLCREAHFINQCPQFIAKSPRDRLSIIRQANRCLNCLSAKHSSSACTSKFACRICSRRHHTMLHLKDSSSAPSRENPITADSESSSVRSTSATALASSTTCQPPRHVMLATARVIVRASSGREYIARALLDQGSEITFISERLARILKARRFKRPISISAVGGLDAGVCKHAVTISITARDRDYPALTTSASILTSVTRYSPVTAGCEFDRSHLAGLKLADPDIASTDRIDVILGADLYSELFLSGVRKSHNGGPIAQETILGWVLTGPVAAASCGRKHITSQICVMSPNVDQELRRFWEIEELPRQYLLTPEEQLCENHFRETHARDSNGRYIIRLPFKNGSPPSFGDSYRIAERRMQALCRKFNADPKLEEDYRQFLADYQQKGHMKRMDDPPQRPGQCVYIPHHAVIRDSSSTTRLRVVFNASSLTSDGTSLNEHLLTGPKLQTELAAVVLRWRQFRYVYSADIEKMYRQILVDPRDVDYQRILWCNADREKLHSYQLQTLTYGTVCAPFLALRVLRQLHSDEGRFFPLAAAILLDNTYVDDLLFGADDAITLRHKRDQLCALLTRGGFRPRKWASNAIELLDDIANSDHGLAGQKTLQIDDQFKILGISWSPATDTFQIRVGLPICGPPTKRAILSATAKLFDPLGWVTPVTVRAKVLLQTLWRQRCDWDDSLPSEISTQWAAIQDSLSRLDGLQLERWTRKDADTESCELHGFADASSSAYAAAVYLRVTSRSGDVTCSLQLAKSKVAPVKTLSIPRLELSAAVLLVRALSYVRVSLNLTTAPCYCWTDSTVVLSWVTQHASKWQTFVANRVAEIQSTLPGASWRHVSTDQNPADCASRGIGAEQLTNHSLWWHGPPWLCRSSAEWPQHHKASRETSLERKSEIAVHVSQRSDPWDLESRFSSWPKLIRVTAYILRFVSRARKTSSENSCALSSQEMQTAREFWLRKIQEQNFPREIAQLKMKHQLSPKSPLRALHPFIGEDKLIRVGGRLANAPLSYRQKHPVILAAHPLVNLIVQNIHMRALHAGTQLMLATLRREFWILRARNLVKSIIHQCVTCTRERASVPTQLMGNLPAMRVSPPSHAFEHSGVDYAGPFRIRAMPGRGIASRKAYIAIFICMATRAIHLEIVDGYSTASFLAAYTRFCARRGLPTAMYSDNGTTFVGADRELTTAFRTALHNPDFQNKTAADHTKWHFMPPAAPHFGGLWESGVRSVKHHLRRVVGQHTLTFEEFATLLCNVEACLNSRPLAPLTDAPDDYEPLTPGHFLIGTALTTPPEPSVLNLNENRLSRWQLVQQLTERLWKLWTADYINSLQQRTKWRQLAETGINIGRVVLIRNTLLPPCKWELGRIIECHPGSDGIIRVVTVKTASSQYKRALNKLCILPIDSQLK